MTYSDVPEGRGIGKVEETTNKYQASVSECAVVHGFGWNVDSAANEMRQALHTQLLAASWGAPCQERLRRGSSILM